MGKMRVSETSTRNSDVGELVADYSGKQVKYPVSEFLVASLLSRSRPEWDLIIRAVPRWSRGGCAW